MYMQSHGNPCYATRPFKRTSFYYKVACITGINFLLFQASEGKHEASEELQTLAFHHRACLVLLTCFALAFARMKKEKKITPVMQANKDMIGPSLDYN